jgi:serine/threonine protein kinase
MFDFANAEQITDPEADRSCLSSDEVLDLASGRATTERLAGMRAHVERCSDCQQLLSGAKECASSGPHELHWATFREGDVVARRYRIHRFVARGGMGEVYDAFDRDLHERVALKTVLSTSNDSFRAVRRLRAEVQLAHRVSHPNVCRIYDLGTHVLPNGSPLNFLTMEFIDGESLRARIERERLSPDESMTIARQLLLGLSAAHAAGILHRDFKSENVMLRATKDGAVQSAVIMDFGLASPMDTNAALFISGANALVGTPCYMSPEQLEGAQLSAASDLYSLGVVWFEMLTGVLPFSLRTPFDRLRRDAPRPSKSRADVPAELDAIVGRCLSRNRSDRFSSAEEALDALDAMSSRVSRITPRGRRFAPRGTAFAAAFAAALLGWGAVKSQALHPARSAPQNVAPKREMPPTPMTGSVTEPGAAGGKPMHDEAQRPASGATTLGAAPATAVEAPLRPHAATMAKHAGTRITPDRLGTANESGPALATDHGAAPSEPVALESTTEVAAPPAADTPTATEPVLATAKALPANAAAPPPSKTVHEHGFLNPFRRPQNP